MRRSKLEVNVDILKVVAQKGPLKFTHIMYKANLNCNVLKKYLEFLLNQGLLGEQIAAKGGIVYKITQKGIILLKSFREIYQMLPSSENENQMPMHLQAPIL
jgi:predicted transcriptional regulator